MYTSMTLERVQKPSIGPPAATKLQVISVCGRFDESFPTDQMCRGLCALGSVPDAPSQLHSLR